MKLFGKYFRLLGPTALTILFILAPIFSIAQTGGTGTDLPTGGTGVDSPTGGTGVDSSDRLVNPLGVDSICALIGVLLNAAIVIGIPIAVLFIVYAGFKFVLARGNPSQLTEARSNMLYTVIGIAIFVGASLIAKVIIATVEQLGVTGVSSC
jgi:hypothetical protein